MLPTRTAGPSGYSDPLERFGEDRQVECFARAEPYHMLGMVCEVLAGAGVREDRQPIAVEGHPLREIPKLLRTHRELAASARVGADGIRMEAPNWNAELGVGSFGKLLSAVELVRIEIDVGVKVADGVHGAPFSRGGAKG